MRFPICNTMFVVPVNTVIVSRVDFAKEVLSRDEFSHRFADGWFVERSFGKCLGK